MLILGTDHDKFLNVDYKVLKNLMKSTGIVIDTRGKLSSLEMLD